MISKLLLWILGDLKTVVTAFANLVQTATELFFSWVRTVAAFWGEMVKPVHIAGWLFVSAAGYGFLALAFEKDEARSVFQTNFLFFAKLGLGFMAAVTGALIAYRNRSYSEHRTEKNGASASNTTFINKPPTP